MRQSVAANRTSHIASLTSQASNAAAAKLLEKKKEFEAVSALERASGLLVKRIEGLGDDCDIMADAGQVHGQVLEQWPNMFRILGLFLAARDQPVATPEDEGAARSALEGERLVRIPIDELQSGSQQNVS